MRVGYIGPHFGEEPPISGTRGSGTVFLSGCSLKCAFCQNYQISHQGLGTPVSLEVLIHELETLIQAHRAHNLNFVTPDHFFPHVFAVIDRLRKKGHSPVVVFNTSGYQSVDMLKYADDYADIYLPDFKYADASLGGRLSKCPDYPGVAMDALYEMIRQKGFLDIFQAGKKISQKGVLVRHLILPGHVENTIQALTNLFLEFGKKLPLSLMSQYYPVRHQEAAELNHVLSREEFDRVYAHVMDLGFEHLFVQFPDQASNHPDEKPPFLPDFTAPKPFE